MGDSHHGFLVKEGAVVKSWKKRYFVLKNEELTYSKKDNADNLGAIDMEDVKSVQPVEYKKKKFCFAVETPKRTYYLVADDEQYAPVRVACNTHYLSAGPEISGAVFFRPRRIAFAKAKQSSFALRAPAQVHPLLPQLRQSLRVHLLALFV